MHEWIVRRRARGGVEKDLILVERELERRLGEEGQALGEGRLLREDRWHPRGFVEPGALAVRVESNDSLEGAPDGA